MIKLKKTNGTTGDPIAYTNAHLMSRVDGDEEAIHIIKLAAYTLLMKFASALLVTLDINRITEMLLCNCNITHKDQI